MLTTALLLPLCLAATAATPQAPDKATPRFDPPVRLRAGDQYVKVEAPGYAAPCWADVDGDGKQDLVVGQFAGGKIKVYRNLGDGQLAAGTWLQAGGTDVEIPGVW